MDKHTQITRQQFQLLLERANKHFGKLRELQTRGDHTWPAAQALFNKTFESFSRLWQFQLSNRHALLASGLQRSELGGIANKIGQLYYNYYLRSGDTEALLESYTFYDAVHTRQYFASATDGAPDPAAAARQMRFYARFVVVCLFLHRREEAMQLLQELQACVSSYTLQYSTPDAHEWQLVVHEVGSLLAADRLALPLPRCPGSSEVPYAPPLRCRLNDPAAVCAPHRPRLREAILVSYRPRQVKVAELPLELFRMAQALEWQQQGQPGPEGQPLEAAPQAPKGPNGHLGAARFESRQTQAEGGGEGGATPSAAEVSGGSPPPPGAPGTGTSGAHSGDGPSSSCSGPSGRGPPRQLLHRPTAQRLLSALLAVTAGLPAAAAGEQFVLLYISADAARSPSSHACQPPTKPQPPVETGLGSYSREAVVAEGSGRGVSSCSAAGSTLRQLLLCPPPHPPLAVHSQPRLARHPPQPHPADEAQPPIASDPAAQRDPAVGGGGPREGSSGAEPSAGPGSGPGLQGDGGVSAGAGESGDVATGGAGCGPSAASDGAAVAAASAADGLLSPVELLVGSRRRVLLLLDSDMGAEFARLQGSERGFPLLCLAAPPWQALDSEPQEGPGGPSSQQPTTTTHGSISSASGSGSPPPAPPGYRSYGSLATMALSCPAQALCAMAGNTDPAPQQLMRLQEVLDEVLTQLGRQMAEQLAAAAATATATSAAAVAATTSGHEESGAAAAAAGPSADRSADRQPFPSPSPAATAPSSSCVHPSSSPASCSSCSAPGPLPHPPWAAWAPVFEDCLARRLMLHFAMFRCCVEHHPLRSRDPALAPTCFPPLPPAADPAAELLVRGLRRATQVLGRPWLFGDAGAGTGDSGAGSGTGVE